VLYRDNTEIITQQGDIFQIENELLEACFGTRNIPVPINVLIEGRNNKIVSNNY